MNITNKAVIRIATCSPEERRKILDGCANLRGIVDKCKELMASGIEDRELIDNLDALIGECSFPMMKQLHGPAFIEETS